MSTSFLAGKKSLLHFKDQKLMLYKLPCEICGFHRHDIEATSLLEI